MQPTDLIRKGYMPPADCLSPKDKVEPLWSFDGIAQLMGVTAEELTAVLIEHGKRFEGLDAKAVSRMKLSEGYLP